MRNLIKLGTEGARIVADDPWSWVREPAEPLPDGPLLLPLALWRQRQSEAVLEGRADTRDGLWLAPDDEPEELAPWLAGLPLIALEFPSFRDGRAYRPTCCVPGWAGRASCVRWATCCATSSATCASAASTPSPCARTSR